MFMVEKEPIGAKLFAKFIRHLLRHIDGNIILIWDNLPAHKSAAVLKEVEASKGRISIEYLPPYAPELNPQEGIWSYLKRHQLANFCLQNLQELKRELRLAVVRTRVNVQLILNIIQGTSLSMEGLLR